MVVHQAHSVEGAEGKAIDRRGIFTNFSAPCSRPALLVSQQWPRQPLPRAGEERGNGQRCERFQLHTATLGGV